MTNVFASQVHKQQYEEGVQDELQDSIPMRKVATIRTDNVEYIHGRYSDDESAENSSDGTYGVSDLNYALDSKLIDKEAVKAHRLRYKEIQREGFDIRVDLADRHGFALAEAIHRHAADIVYQVATGVLDNEVLSGGASALTPISLSDTNPDNVGATIMQVLQERGAYGGGTPFIMMSPKSAKKFNLFSMGAGQAVSDGALRDGLAQLLDKGLFGLDVISTNEVPRSVKSTTTSGIQADDTYAITVFDRTTGASSTITFTYKASPASAGEVDVGVDDETSLANLAEAINAAAGQGPTSGAGTKYIALSAANQVKLKNAGIRAVSTATTLTVTGFRYFTVTEGMTGTTTAAAIENIIAGMRGAPMIALPSKGFHVDEKPITGFNGIELVDTQIHDAHVSYKDRGKLVRVLVAA